MNFDELNAELIKNNKNLQALYEKMLEEQLRLDTMQFEARRKELKKSLNQVKKQDKKRKYIPQF